MADQAEFHLMDLASEMQLHIASFLPWPDLTALRLVSSHFCMLITPTVLKRRRGPSITAVHADETYLLHCFLEVVGEKGLCTRGEWGSRELTINLDLPTNSGTRGYTKLSAAALDGLPFFRRAPFQHGWDHHQLGNYWLDCLPCYTCLRWLPATHSIDLSMPNNYFSRRAQRAPGIPNGDKIVLPTNRICIPCGIRKNVYPPGARIAHYIRCLGCSKLEHRCGPFGPRYWIGQPESPPIVSSKYCAVCQKLADIESLARIQLLHELHWSRYERAMRDGKAARVQRGVETRAAMGVGSSTRHRHSLVETDPGRVGHYCPVMLERRLCDCHKGNLSTRGLWSRHIYTDADWKKLDEGGLPTDGSAV